MERKNPYLQIAAVVSAVLLVGAFVSYRAGAFQKPATPAPPEPDAAALFDFETPPVANDDQKSQMFIYSSKSAPAFTPAPAPTPPAAEKRPVFMGGSKRAEIILPQEGAPNPLAP